MTGDRTKIIGRDVESGDVIHEYGLVLSINCDQPDCWYGDKAHIHFLCYQDPHMGGCLATFNLDDTFTLITGDTRKAFFKRAKKDLKEYIKALREDIELIKEAERLDADGE